MPKTKIPSLKPCPCCGNKKLYIGHLMAMVLGVKCERPRGCGLEVGRQIPDRWPAKLKSPKDPDGWMRLLDAYTLKQAIKVWNRRTK